MWQRFKSLSKIGKVFVVGSALTVIGIASNLSGTSEAPKNVALTTNKAAAESVAEKPKPKIELKTTNETTAIPFGKTTVNDATLTQGTSVIKTKGVNGTKTYTYEIQIIDGVAGERKLISEAVTTPPTTEVTAVGTKAVASTPAPATSNSSCDHNYSPCIPNASYDLDCSDIGFTVTVKGSDHHRLDRDGNGLGCE